MTGNELGKPYPIRLTYHQNIAFDRLKFNGYKKSEFIRIAINEKLHREFRTLLKENNKINIPF